MNKLNDERIKIMNTCEKLLLAKEEMPGKDLVWLEWDVMSEAIFSPDFCVHVIEINTDQGDETFKTVILFEGQKFVYVGDKI